MGATKEKKLTGHNFLNKRPADRQRAETLPKGPCQIPGRKKANKNALGKRKAQRKKKRTKSLVSANTEKAEGAGDSGRKKM